jgi:hypothetical protein
MQGWVKGAIATFAALLASQIGSAPLAQVQGGNGPPPRPQPHPPGPRPPGPLRPPIIQRPSLTLYARPNYAGRSVTFIVSIANLQSVDFNDRARSLRVRGRWRICEHANYRGRCVVVTQDLPGNFALARQASSARLEGR